MNVQALYKKSNSPAEFLQTLSLSKIQTYQRNKVLTGVYFPNSQRKIRLQNLGFDTEQILLLNKGYRKLRELEEKLNNKKDKKKTKNRIKR